MPDTHHEGVVPRDRTLPGGPAWICWECAHSCGGSMPDGHLATFHADTCGVCDQRRQVTEIRDYRLLRVTPEQWQRARVAAQQRIGGG